jgi:hypothetical protein
MPEEPVPEEPEEIATPGGASQHISRGVEWGVRVGHGTGVGRHT